MSIKPHELNAHLDKSIAPVYLFHGAEALLVDDSARLLAKTLKEKGFTERMIFTLETGFDWSQFLLEFDSFSLFSQKKLIELRAPTGKLGTKGAEALLSIVQSPLEDTILLISCGKLEAGVKNSKWFKQVSQSGVAIEHFAVNPGQLLNWIGNRAKHYGLSMDASASRLLAYYLEGNLLAIDQELKKFALLTDHRSISAQIVEHSVQSGARYSIYTLVDAALSGDLKRSLRMLASLRAEGVEPVLINWAFARESRSLLQMANEVAQGKSIAAVLQQFRVWRNRAGIVEASLKRLNFEQIKQIHSKIAGLDRQVKGKQAAHESAAIWTEYERMIAQLCGAGAR